MRRGWAARGAFGQAFKINSARRRFVAGILEHVSSTECDKERARLEAIVEDEEKLALAAVEVRPDALEVLTALKANGEPLSPCHCFVQRVRML